MSFTQRSHSRPCDTPSNNRLQRTALRAAAGGVGCSGGLAGPVIRCRNT